MEAWPKIDFVDDRDGCLFIASVHRSEIGNSPQRLEKGSEKRSEKTEEVILHLIEQNPRITIKELSDFIGIAPRNIELQLAKLKKAERIERIGPDRGGYWKIK